MASARRVVDFGVFGLCLAAVACAGADVEPPRPAAVDASALSFRPGPRVQVALGVSMEVPAPLRQGAGGLWQAALGAQVVAAMRVEVIAPAPADGAEVWARDQVAGWTRSGVAGVVRDDRLELGDLDGRRVELLQTAGEPRGALMLLVVEDERRLVAITIALPAALLTREGATLRAALASVRLAAP